MKNIIYVIMVLMISIVTKSIAQDRSCSTMENLAYQLEKDPGLKDRMESIEKFTSSFINNHKSGNRDVVYTIPIVVHVVYNGSSENISDAQVLSQIDVLNEDFRRLNADANGTWSQASDSEIEFCLATMDPSGNASNGITRTSTNVSTFGLNDEIKFNSSGGKDAWPASDYLNLWVGDLPNGYLGYAQFPGGAAATDGVVIDYIYFGTSGTATSPFDLGRTATHEVGHWLNLRHIWGDGNCSQDDFVTDTPSSDAPNYGCASGHVSCSTTDMVENYMDYSDDACMNLFTSGQRSRMRALFGSGGSKESLLNSTGCGSGTSSSCTDGIQNGNETGIDCGGSDCAPCSTECANNDVNISITFDNYPEETSWEIINSSGSVIESGGTYGSEADGATLSIDVCLLNGCYDFVISDSYGDGICCSYGNGSYIVTEGGVTLANGGSFGVTELTNFCIGTSAPTCTDGVQNGDETGIDCGGSNCVECPSCTDGIQNGNETGVDCGGTECAPCSSSNSEVFAHYFESGWDGWSDGGSDCYRYNGSRSYEGTKSIRLRDNSGSSSSMTSSSYDVSSYNSLEIEFYFYPYSMENGEDFYVKYYDGTNWHTIAVYTKGTNFSNNNFYVATVNIDGSYNMPSNARFRFQCDASNNSDHIYIDAVTVTGITGGSKTNNIGQSIIALSPMFDNEEEVNELDFQMYPNPASNILNITAQEKIYVINIYSLEGKVIQSINTNTERIDVDVSSLSSGLYIISLETEEEVYTDKFIKR